MKVISLLKNWSLPISMLTGIAGYFVYANLPFLAPTKFFVAELVAYIQPILLFCMLFLTFCRVKPTEMRPYRWHLWLVLIQLFLFGLLTYLLYLFTATRWRSVLECAMLCLMCPTATACAVVTTKLGGSATAVTTYTLIINIAIAIMAPLLLPIAHPHVGVSFLPAFCRIIHKVFPLLICPLILAWLVRYCVPAVHRWCLRQKDLAFYLWTVSLSIAVATACKALVHCGETVFYISVIAFTTMACCVVQFAAGKLIGQRYGMRLEGGQSLGQKNTVFIMWLGYTFLDPVSVTAGGFYSIWHNIVNAYQLYKYRTGKFL